jgi:protein-S-isoprenylcysteine O-methyltransferase Ste14
MSKLDVPPVWLIGAIVLVWALDRLFPLPLFGVLSAFGPLLVLAGLILLFGGAAQMAARKTTFIPKRRPTALVTNGFFRLCRNPIYLGDALILAGLILWWDVPLGLPVLALFVWLITTRFILAEEAMLRRVFGGAYDDWVARSGRWLPRL